MTEADLVTNGGRCDLNNYCTLARVLLASCMLGSFLKGYQRPDLGAPSVNALLTGSAEAGYNGLQLQ